jgi:hypothetical protein
VEGVVGDAASVPPRLGPLAAVFSAFALQQIPRPDQVLAAWTGALMPGGVLAVCFWPRAVEAEGPWRRLADISFPATPQADWEQGIPSAALGQGAELLYDQRVAHEMAWPSVDAFWEGMTRAGPWHARRMQRGDAHMEELRQAFMRGYPDPVTPLVHAPNARLLALRRRPATKL